MKFIATIRVYKDVNVVIPDSTCKKVEQEAMSRFGEDKISKLKEKGYSVAISTIQIRDDDMVSPIKIV